LFGDTFGNGARMDQHRSIAHVSRHTEPRDFLLHVGYHRGRHRVLGEFDFANIERLLLDLDQIVDLAARVAQCFSLKTRVVVQNVVGVDVQSLEYGQP
jgi:hypothetical protein